VRPASCETISGGFASTTAMTSSRPRRRPARVGARPGAARRARSCGRVELEHRLVLEVDDGETVRGLHVSDHEAPSCQDVGDERGRSSGRSGRRGTRAAGSEVGRRERVTRAGRVARLDAPGADELGDPIVVDDATARSERDDDLGHAELRQRTLVVAVDEHRRLVLGDLQDRHEARTSGS
jgi:hypothetical protein